MDTRQTAAAGSEEAGRAVARVMKATRRCSCKKSGCLKLYCECFAGGGRCGDGCQCVGCKNQEHNQLEIAHAVQTIEKRAQKSSRASAAATKSVDMPDTGFSLAFDASKPPPPPPPRIGTPAVAAASNGSDAATSAHSNAPVTLLGSTKATRASPLPAVTIAPSVGNGKGSGSTLALREPCSCRGGCSTACPCLALFNECLPSCSCHGCQPQRREKTKGCSCKKSHCLKLYCECLAAQRMCDELCNCEGCKNCSESFAQRERAIAAILDRNPMAFQPKVASGTSQHLRGCNCRKSGCMKNYCECFQAGVPCTARCACHQCRNTDTFVSAKKVVMMGGIEAAAEAISSGHVTQQLHQRQPQRGRSSQKALRRRPNIMASSSGPTASNPASSSTVLVSNRRISALELLSESAPSAPQSVQVVAFSSRTPSSRYPSPSAAASLLSLRPEDRDQLARVRHPQPTAMGGTDGVTPSFVKRKYTKVGSSQALSVELGGGIRASSAHGRSSDVSVIPPPLPDVDTILDGAYGINSDTTSNAPASGVLSMLCQSLLSAAMAVESKSPDAPSSARPYPATLSSPRAQSVSADGDHHMLENELEDEEMAPAESDGDGNGDVAHRRQGSLSPGASGLLCDEDMLGDDDPSQDDGRASHWAMPRSKDTHEQLSQEHEKQASNSTARVAAAQERAVLQEFSVWLRNMSAAPIAKAGQ